MKVKVLRYTLLLVLITTFSYNVNSQISLGLGPTSYVFTNSQDANFHYGGNIRLSYTEEKILVDFGFSYFFPVITNIPDVALEKDPSIHLFPNPLNIYNAVTGRSIETFLHCHYYFIGMSDRGLGVYGLLGAGYFYYEQEYNLSFFDPIEYYPETYVDGVVNSSYQITANAGGGIKTEFRRTSIFAETKFSLATQLNKDYGNAVLLKPYFSFSLGLRYHLKMRKSYYETKAMGRNKRTIKKERKRIRRK
ncbi:MAG: hypothetical protein HN704_09455 [Bacteroidetes bacterium]|jgi:hypothetical protein|nr:hypothetical protein [Bacteroidota bacterium]MBT6685622.1 hypothetical protein [Bacteroidota bacterium]MBT7144699.1 hypothetical protein [Bacteroidota bacterium]MBT7491820.1 hypothetical protein [Bacteroidota bacterium]